LAHPSLFFRRVDFASGRFSRYSLECMTDRSQLLTEQRLPDSMGLDAMSIEDAIALMNRQDQRAVEAVARQTPQIAAAVRLVVLALQAGGRLLYVGAGSSGRLGVLDAAECPPTFRTDPQRVQGIIAGGNEAMFQSREGAEDLADEGAAAMDARNVNAHDVVMGIAAGGTTPFVHGALRQASTLGARTVFLSCVQPLPDEPAVDVVIRPLTGPEVITGSTRLKAGTATKLVLNMISTLSMVQLNKVYENLMVDLRATNAKLWDRGARMVSTLTNLDRAEAMELLKRAEGHVKVAIVMHRRDISADRARQILAQHGGNLRKAL
jgi:N-acetylmuramic acid 6-phosphate etherase